MPKKPFKIKIFQLGGRGEYPIIMEKLQLPPQYFDIANIYERPSEVHRQVIYDKMYLYSGYLILGFAGLFSQVGEEEFRVNKKNWWMHDLKQLIQQVSMYNPGANIPVLGICWGSQVLAYLFGENIHENPQGPEVGLVPIKLTKAGMHDILFRGIETDIFYAYENHKYDIKRLSRHYILLAEGEHTKIQAFRFHDYPIWGIQFHPEHNPETARGSIAWRKDAGQIPKHKKIPIGILYDDGSKGTPETDKVMLNFRAICEAFYRKTANK